MIFLSLIINKNFFHPLHKIHPPTFPISTYPNYRLFISESLVATQQENRFFKNPVTPDYSTCRRRKG